MKNIPLITAVGVKFLDPEKCPAAIQEAINAGQATIPVSKEVSIPADLAEAVKKLGDSKVYEMFLDAYILSLHGEHRADILAKIGTDDVKASGRKAKQGFSL